MREMSALQRGTPTPSRAVSPAGLAAGALLALGACGGEPPETLGGFGLDLTQQEVMDAAAARGGFNCRLRATYPAEAVCEGPAEEGVVTIHVRGDSVVRVALRLEPDAEGEPGGHVRRFVDPFGDPAWRDRPHPPRSSPPEGYHTQWLDRDSVRGLALVCAGPGLRPPCAAELAETSPAGVRARLDTLLGIPR